MGAGFAGRGLRFVWFVWFVDNTGASPSYRRWLLDRKRGGLDALDDAVVQPVEGVLRGL